MPILFHIPFNILYKFVYIIYFIKPLKIFKKLLKCLFKTRQNKKDHSSIYEKYSLKSETLEKAHFELNYGTQYWTILKKNKQVLD